MHTQWGYPAENAALCVEDILKPTTLDLFKIMQVLHAVDEFDFVVLTADRAAESQVIIAQSFADEPTVSTAQLIL